MVEPNNMPMVVNDADDYAVLHITLAGESGYAPDPIAYDLSDDDIRRMAAEAVSGNNIAGLRDQEVTPDTFANFVVERHDATPAAGGKQALPNRLFLRPKAEIG